jgi:single-strand DNA-binding protein
VVAGVNRWHGIGNMTGDPELKQGDDADKDRTMFSVAINRPGQDAEATFLEIICWGKLAGQVNDFGRKGRQVYIEGEIEVRRWETDDGDKRKMWRIKAYTVRFLDRKPDDADDEPTRKREPKNTAKDFDDLPF